MKDAGLFVVGEAGSMFRSADWGQTWEKVQGPYEGTLFGALGTAQVLFQIAAQVLQHVAVGATGGRAAQGAHQLTEIAGGQLVQVLLAEVAQQAAEGLLLLRVGGHQQVLVAGVEVDQTLTADAIGQQALPTGVDEHAVEEVFAQYRVVQAAFLFQRQLRVAGMQGGGEDAAAAFFGQMTVISVQFYPVQAAGGRLLHQHEAAEAGRYAIDLGTQRLADIAILLLGHQCARRFRLADADTACTPGYTPVTLANASADASAFLFVADETPLHRKLGVYEVRGGPG